MNSPLSPSRYALYAALGVGIEALVIAGWAVAYLSGYVAGEQVAAKAGKENVMFVFGLCVAVLIAVLGAWWLPGATINHAARISPPAQRSEIGRQVLADLVRVAGPPCRRVAG